MIGKEFWYIDTMEISEILVIKKVEKKMYHIDLDFNTRLYLTYILGIYIWHWPWWKISSLFAEMTSSKVLSLDENSPQKYLEYLNCYINDFGPAKRYIEQIQGSSKLAKCLFIFSRFETKRNCLSRGRWNFKIAVTILLSIKRVLFSRVIRQSQKF